MGKTMSAEQELTRYVERYFVDRDQFLRSAGIENGLLQGLVNAHALPGPIYRLWCNGSFWSPIGGQAGIAERGEPQSEWFSPAAIWWARRAKVLASSQDVSPNQIASVLRGLFCEDFAKVVRNRDQSRYGYPDLFKNGEFEESRFEAVAIAEWNDWIDGGYGVCLKRMDALHLVCKTNETARVRHITEDGHKDQLSPQETLDLLDALDRLDAVMLPFAPHQRPFGTPGKWVDAIMAKYHLGSIPLIQYRSSLDLKLIDEQYCA